MKSNSKSRKQPPSRRPLDIPGLSKASNGARSAAGGPATRGDTKLGQVLADFLAYFEVRTVTTREIDLLRPTHDNGWLRPQVEAKLQNLHPTCPDHRELRRLVELSLDLLTAVDTGRFHPGPHWAKVEPKLLRALAYFVRDGDAIPDHLPHGYDDDMREFQLLAKQATDLFSVFEAVQSTRRLPRQA
jgi:uncharacterized membrane protein YkvA (DUF1232 family)